MEVLDTQVISYSIKGQYSGPLSGKAISSITANELLLVQTDNPSRANYYVPLLSKRALNYGMSNVLTIGREFYSNIRANRIWAKRRADRVIMDFSGDFPTIVEFCNLAISVLINNRESRIFSQAITSLEKERRKTVWNRFVYLLDNQVICIPLSKNAVKLAQHLLREFTKGHNLKNNFRNSWNDLLILSTAINSASLFVTKDNELNRFAAAQYSIGTSRIGKFVKLDFQNYSEIPNRRNAESRGYINRGWSVKFRNYGNSLQAGRR